MRLSRVEVRGAGKVFGRVVALRAVDLRLEDGACVVVVGPNGAGKSTLLALLATLARPTTGTVLYDGRSSRDHGAALRGAIGFAGEEPLGYGELTGRENLLLRARLHRVERPADRVHHLIVELGLTGPADRPMGGYSQGERRRLGLAGALLHEPSLLLFDEPTSGLDGAGGLALARLLRSRVEAGAIVLVTSHDPWLAAEVGDRVVALDRGEVVFDRGAPDGEHAWRAVMGGGSA